jgi:hypothetical protein
MNSQDHADCGYPLPFYDQECGNSHRELEPSIGRQTLRFEAGVAEHFDDLSPLVKVQPVNLVASSIQMPALAEAGDLASQSVLP